jgi:organic hydroperoxide reductase OsmC/OhrA
LWSEATGEVEADGKVLILRRIHVRYHARIPSEKRDVVERILAVHADSCPIARSLQGSIGIVTSLAVETG